MHVQSNGRDVFSLLGLGVVGSNHDESCFFVFQKSHLERRFLNHIFFFVFQKSHLERCFCLCFLEIAPKLWRICTHFISILYLHSVNIFIFFNIFPVDRDDRPLWLGCVDPWGNHKKGFVLLTSVHIMNKTIS